MPQGTVQEQVMARAVKDPTFRQELLSTPRAVLAQEYYVTIPEHIAVRVLEDGPNTLTPVLPFTEAAVQELTEAELEAVAGGDPIVTTFPF